MAAKNQPMPLAKDVSWHDLEFSEIMEAAPQKLTMRFKANGTDISLSIAFPMEGGMRICSEKQGFFMPSGFHTMDYRQEEPDVLEGVAGDLRFALRHRLGDWTLALYSANSRCVFQMANGDLALGQRDGEFPCVKVRGPLHEGEILYGLGERFNSLNQVGARLKMWNMDTCYHGSAPEGEPVDAYKNIPFLHSSRGYSLFLNSSYCIDADFGQKEPGIFTLESYGPILDLFFYAGTPLENIEQYTNLTGKPLLPPKWAFDYWAGGGYEVWGDNPEETIRSCMDGYAQMGIPSVAALYGEGKAFETQACYQILNERGTRMLAWNFPAEGLSGLEKKLPEIEPVDYPQLKLFDLSNHDVVAPDGRSNWIDYSHPNAGLFIQRKYSAWWEMGLRGCMVDFGEYLPEGSVAYNGMTGDEMHNFHSYCYNKAFHDAWEERFHGDYVLFSRSSYAGCQKWACNFGGDQSADFRGLRYAIRAGLSFCSSGFSFWGSDLGGYSGTPTEEVYIRWLQFSAFSPLMRSHGAPTGRDPWLFGKRAVSVFQRYFWLRQSMLSFIYGKAIAAHKTGIPLMQAMAVAFPEEPYAGWEDQYLFCSEFLAAPVENEGTTARRVAFPHGNWIHFWSGKAVRGGAVREVPAPLEDMPLFVRSGAVIPVNLTEDLELCGSGERDEGVFSLLVTLPENQRRTLFYTDEEHSYAFESFREDKGNMVLGNPDGCPVSAVLLLGEEAVCGAYADGIRMDVERRGAVTVIRCGLLWKKMRISFDTGSLSAGRRHAD